MQEKKSIVEFSVDHPRLVLVVTAALTVLFLTQFQKIRIDTNPKNMLPQTSSVRVWNDEVEKAFGLHEDTIVVGIVNEDGVLNRRTLGKVIRMTDEAARIKGVAASDITGFPTITNVTVEHGVLRVAPLMEAAAVPGDDKEADELRESLFANPMFIDRVISKDGKTTAVYVPLEKGANGKEVADKLREIVKKEGGPEKYHIAGDPVARDTFGAEMFKLMGIFSPIAGMIMFAVAYVMFRSFFLAASIMIPAMVIIIWSMGLLIGMGFPVHIMSSMSPVFLMAIATDSIHIFNEFCFRFREGKERKAAIIETMKAVGVPLVYSDLTTAVGFGSLLLANIIPVKVFGLGVAFGTLVLLLSSFTLIPAFLMFIGDEKLSRASSREEAGAGRTPALLSRLAGLGAMRPKATVAVGFVLLIIAVAGVTMISVNNNMVGWFKKGSDIRRADAVINSSLGGTSLAYVVAVSDEEDFIKTPEAMRYIDGLQRRLERLKVVGKTASVVDYVKRINLVLHDNDPKYDSVPGAKGTIGQYLFLFGMSARPSDLDSVVDYPFRRANVWVQLKTWDAGAMRDVMKAVDEYKRANQDIGLELKPAGIAYFNLVWNDEVLWDMLKGFIFAMAVIFVILSYNFRSVKWAAVAYMPLLFTITLIYGVIGFMGKDFDMPIAVLSCLSLGMAVDFSIHFIGRFRQRLAEASSPAGTPASTDITEALLWTASRPGRGIMRNAVLFASAFSVMLFAPLTPYITVGAFIAAMMMLSAFFTIIYLPALIVLMKGRLLKPAKPVG
ncbi:MAG: MMPL family transporter [Deltaproteobacteria bacterium]|nr:MMPL family transporter [Deltaproteobacteria bacterium]